METKWLHTSKQMPPFFRFSPHSFGTYAIINDRKFRKMHQPKGTRLIITTMLFNTKDLLPWWVGKQEMHHQSDGFHVKNCSEINNYPFHLTSHTALPLISFSIYFSYIIRWQSQPEKYKTKLLKRKTTSRNHINLSTQNYTKTQLAVDFGWNLNAIIQQWNRTEE